MTDMSWNLLLMLVVIVAFAGLLFVLFRNRPEKEDIRKKFTYEQLCIDTRDMINRIVGADFRGLGLSEKALQNQRKQREIISSNVRRCCSGDEGARSAVKELIKNYLSKDRGVNEDTILFALPFNHPQDMSARSMAEALMLYFDSTGASGFSALCKDYGWEQPVIDRNGNEVYEITEERVRKTWRTVMPSFSYAQQLEVLTQLIYADTVGLGVIDILNAQKGSIEEIQVGLTGLPEKFYDYRQELINGSSDAALEYSKDSIHVLVRGTTIRLKYLSFPTDDEQQRVLRNLLVGTNSGELTVSNPEIVVDTMDGRRISLSRPHMSDAWVGFVRKFDAIQKSSLSDWCSDMKQGDEVASLVRCLVRAKCSIGITGEMAAGKTTFLRTCLFETSPDQNIRIVEADSFEVGARRFLAGRNTLALRVTKDHPEEEVLALIRKTTGHVFCVSEITAPSMANLAMNLAKIAQQIIFSAHYITTDDMVADFKNARLSVGGFTDERLAEMDAVRSLGFNIHLRKHHGLRYIQYIDEIVPAFDLSKNYDNSEITTENASVKVASGLREVRTQLGNIKTYTINRIFEYDVLTGEYSIKRPTDACLERARYELAPELYEEFLQLFDGRVF